LRRLGTAIAYPQAKKLHSMGVEVHTIAGFRNKDLIILEDEMRAVSSKLFITPMTVPTAIKVS